MKKLTLASLFSLCIVPLLLAQGGVSTQAPQSQSEQSENAGSEGRGAQLVVSTSSDRENAQPLEGAALSGEVYIFFDPTLSNLSGDIDEVTFYLNDSGGVSPLQIEAVAPYDFAGSKEKDAYPFNLDELSRRKNTVTAEVTLSSGDVQTFLATFTAEGVQETLEADLYVSPDGDDDADGSVDEPFGTVAKALSVVKAGERIQLREGVYKEYVDGTSFEIANGSQDAPITIEGYPGERAIIDGDEVHWSDVESVGYPALFRLEEIRWFVVQNLTFRNSAGRSLHLEGDYNVVRDVLSYDNHSDGVYITGDNNLLDGIISHGNYSEQNGGESADGIKLAYGDANVIRNCRTYNNSDDGVDIWQSSNTLVEFCSSFENGRGRTGDGSGFKLGSSGGDYSDNSYATVRYNIGYKNKLDNFYTNGGGGITLLHNTSWRAGRNGFLFSTRGEPNVAWNNISYKDSGLEYSEDDEHSNNTWNLGIEDPGFISLDPDSPDFLRLEEGSPAVNAGAEVDLPYAGEAPDLGALERAQEVADSKAEEEN